MLHHSPWQVRSPYFFPDEGLGVTIDEQEEEGEGEEEEEQEEEEQQEEEQEEQEEGEEKGEKKEEEPALVRVDFGQIKEKYPKFFKDFPDLKHAFFREQQFTEIFPTIEDASKAAEAQAAYEEITNAIVSGDANTFLTELKKEDSDGLEKFAKNFVPALREINKDLYLDVVAPSVQQFIRNVYSHGISEKNENIKNAAKIVHKLLFGGDYSDIEKVTEGLLKTERSRDEKDNKEKDNRLREKYNTLFNDVSNSCYSKLEEEIGKGLSDLDKTRPGLKKLIVKDVRERVLSTMDKDTAYLSRMQSLWKREERMGFNGSLKSSFETTFLAKARTLVPKLRAEARKEALGKEDNSNENENRTRLTGNRESRTNGTRMTPERAKAEKLSTRQIFD